MSHLNPDTDLSLQIAQQMLEVIPQGAPAGPAIAAVLTVLRYIAIENPDLAERIATVLNHTAAELITGQIFIVESNAQGDLHV